MRWVEIQTANHRTDYRLVAFRPPAATAVAAVTGVRNYLLSRHNSSYSPFFWVVDFINLTHLTCILSKFYVVVVPDTMHYVTRQAPELKLGKSPLPNSYFSSRIFGDIQCFIFSLHHSAGSIFISFNFEPNALDMALELGLPQGTEK